MTTKLTLSLDNNVIKSAKRMAKDRKKSLSKLVGDLLIEEMDKETKEKLEIINKLPAMFSDIKKLDNDTDWKVEARKAAHLKHGQ